MNRILALCVLLGLVTGSLSGIVSPTQRCGGYGTPIQLRIGNCEGRCLFYPGAVYHSELDFMPSSATPSLHLRIDVCLSGFCHTILETELANSSVQPGFLYTARYSIVPNDVLSGSTIEVHAYLYKADTQTIEICLKFEADVLEL